MQMHTAPAAHTAARAVTTVEMKRGTIIYCKRTLSWRVTIKEFINSSVIPGHPVETAYAHRL